MINNVIGFVSFIIKLFIVLALTCLVFFTMILILMALVIALI